MENATCQRPNVSVGGRLATLQSTHTPTFSSLSQGHARMAGFSLYRQSMRVTSATPKTKQQRMEPAGSDRPYPAPPRTDPPRPASPHPAPPHPALPDPPHPSARGSPAAGTLC